MQGAQRVDHPRSEFQTVLCQARAGDNSARARLYLEYGQHFRQLIARRLRRRQLTWATTPHDIFDIVVLRVWQEDTLTKLKDEVEFLKYVSRAVDHEILDLHRSLIAGCRDYRRQEPLQDAHASSIATQVDPVRQVGASDELAWIRAQLSPLDREVLDLWLGGHGWTAVAAQLGVTADGIRKQFHRSLAMIRQRAEFSKREAER